VEPERVLDLIHSAPGRYDTVRVALRYRGDGTTIKEVRERFLRSEGGRRAFGIPPQEAAEPSRRPARYTEPEGPFGWRTRA